MEALKKITAKTLGFTMPAIRAKLANVENGVVVDLFKIGGIVSSTKAGASDFGSWLKLQGEFAAVVLETGEVYASPVAMLPEQVTAQVDAALQGGDAVEFGIVIGVKRRDDIAVGYEYTVHSLIDLKPTKRMQALLESTGIVTKALAAPEPEYKPDPEPEPASGKKRK